MLRQDTEGIAKQGRTSQTAISIPSEDEDQDEDEDDFEEVAIPGASTPVTPARGQSVATNTPGTNTTAPSIDDDFDGYGDEEEEEEGGEKDDVIRLEIGGENDEEKAKRIALAMRKWVFP